MTGRYRVLVDVDASNTHLQISFVSLSRGIISKLARYFRERKELSIKRDKSLVRSVVSTSVYKGPLGD